MMKYFLFIGVIISMSCCIKNNDRIIQFQYKLSHAGFDTRYWKDDTLGCNSSKKTYNAKILANQKFLNSCKKEEIIKLLGKPYRTTLENEQIRFYYVIDGKLMCDNLKYKHILKDSENSYLIISFSKDSLIDMNLIGR